MNCATSASSGLLTVSRELVELGPKRLWTDVGAIHGAIDPAEVADHLQDIQWPLLSDLDDVTPELDDWLRAERTRVSGQIVRAGTEAAEAGLASGDAASARRIADALERIDPLDERAAQAGIQADIAIGDRSGAHRRMERLEKRLKDELGLAPSPDTRTLLNKATADKSLVTPDGVEGPSDRADKKQAVAPPGTAHPAADRCSSCLFLPPKHRRGQSQRSNPAVRRGRSADAELLRQRRFGRDPQPPFP